MNGIESPALIGVLLEVPEFSGGHSRVTLRSYWGAPNNGRSVRDGCFFPICNYEQVLLDIFAIDRAKRDLIILDEGQRVKNWGRRGRRRQPQPASLPHCQGAQNNVCGWLFRVARNQATNRQRNCHRRFAERLDPNSASMLDETTPERVVLEREKLHRLAEAIAAPTDSERQCVLLRAAGLRYREIGEALNMATSTVGDTVQRLPLHG